MYVHSNFVIVVIEHRLRETARGISSTADVKPDDIVNSVSLENIYVHVKYGFNGIYPSKHMQIKFEWLF